MTPIQADEIIRKHEWLTFYCLPYDEYIAMTLDRRVGNQVITDDGRIYDIAELDLVTTSGEA